MLISLLNTNTTKVNERIGRLAVAHLLFSVCSAMNFTVVIVYWSLLHAKQTAKYADHP